MPARCAGATLRPQGPRQFMRCHGAGGVLGGAAPVSLVAHSHLINPTDAAAARGQAGGRAARAAAWTLSPWRASTADLGRAGRNRALPGSARFSARYSIQQGAVLYTG